MTHAQIENTKSKDKNIFYDLSSRIIFELLFRFLSFYIKEDWSFRENF